MTKEEIKANELISYGFIIEFKDVKYSDSKWINHWNHKIYRSKTDAEQAIEQMKKIYPFYKNDYEWKIIELYQLNKY